ncbi:MAG: hypothetical protein IH610_13755, partial [Deltaproteobacteria bacterium]|nr:hypothetical protein [Deltaproteobacteria bacterium]
MNSSAVLLLLLSFGHMCTDMVQGALPALLPYLKERFDLSYAAAGALLMAAHLTSSVIQPLFGYVTDRRPFPILLPLGCAAISSAPAAAYDRSNRSLRYGRSAGRAPCTMSVHMCPKERSRS